MMTPRLISLTTALFLIMSALQSQPEKIFVHFDKPFYLAGETARFKAFFIQSGDSTQSAILRSEWIAPSGKSLGLQRTLVEGRGSEGSFQISESTAEGYYTFRAYTLRNLDYDPGFIFQKEIAVYNDLADAPEGGAADDDFPQPAIPKESTNCGLQIIPGKKLYGRRDRATVSLTLTDAAGRPAAGAVSVSVVDAQGIPLDLFQEKQIVDVARNYHGLSEALRRQSFPTERNLELWGVVKLPSTGELIRQNYLSLYTVEDKTFRRFNSLNGDTVRLSVPFFYGSRTIQALCFNPNFPNVLRWEPADPGPGLPAAGAKKPVPHVAALDRFLRQERLRRKTMEIFNNGSDTLQTAQAAAFSAPQWTPDKRFFAKDYQNLATMEEFFHEVVVISTVETTPTGKRLRMFEGDDHTLNHLPVRFAVDDVFEADAEKILNMKFSEVERVDMFNKKATIAGQLDSFAYRGGVMAIYTKAGLIKATKAGSQRTIIEGLSRNVPFTTPRPVEKTPDFRWTLYWNPDARIPESGRLEISFPLSDVISTYRIRAQGTTQKGEPIFGEGTIVVGR